MKNYVKLAAVGVAGYLIGFYEMKYKVMKVMLENTIKEDLEESEKDKEEEET